MKQDSDILALFSTSQLFQVANVSKCKMLVLDEADKLLSQVRICEILCIFMLHTSYSSKVDTGCRVL